MREVLGPAMARPDRADAGHAVPRRVDHVARDPPDLVLQHARNRTSGSTTRPQVHSPPWRMAWCRSGSGCCTTSRRAAASSPIRCGSGSTRSPRRVASIARSSSSRITRADCPPGSEHDIKRAFAELDAGGAIAIIGPSISDNALIAAPLCDAARLPAINYSGGERTRSQWMFHYQVGSLEEEPPLLAAHGRTRLAQRGGGVRPVAGRPPVRRVLRSRAGSPRPRGHRHREHLVAGRERRRSADAPARRQPRRARVLRPRRLVTRGRRRAHGSRLGRSRARELRAHVRLRASRLARRLRGLGVHRHRRRRQPPTRRAEGALAPRGRRTRSAARPTTWAACSARRSRSRII